MRRDGDHDPRRVSALGGGARPGKATIRACAPSPSSCDRGRRPCGSVHIARVARSRFRGGGSGRRRRRGDRAREEQSARRRSRRSGHAERWRPACRPWNSRGFSAYRCRGDIWPKAPGDGPSADEPGNDRLLPEGHRPASSCKLASRVDRATHSCQARVGMDDACVALRRDRPSRSWRGRQAQPAVAIPSELANSSQRSSAAAGRA